MEQKTIYKVKGIIFEAGEFKGERATIVSIGSAKTALTNDDLLDLIGVSKKQIKNINKLNLLSKSKKIAVEKVVKKEDRKVESKTEPVQEVSSVVESEDASSDFTF